jgi:sulfoxide reductase heme-binding subunit YedZ
MWYTTRATGLVALLLFTATVVLGLLTAGRASGTRWPRFVQQDLHRRISLLAVVFLSIHILTSVLDTYVHIGWIGIVVPFTSPYERFFVGLGAV